VRRARSVDGEAQPGVPHGGAEAKPEPADRRRRSRRAKQDERRRREAVKLELPGQHGEQHEREPEDEHHVARPLEQEPRVGAVPVEQRRLVQDSSGVGAERYLETYHPRRGQTFTASRGWRALRVLSTGTMQAHWTLRRALRLVGEPNCTLTDPRGWDVLSATIPPV